MYNLVLARGKTLLLWGGIEALLGGLAWQSYRNKTLSPALLGFRKNTMPSRSS